MILRRISSIEKRPGPLKNVRTKIVRYIRASSLTASGSPACMMNTATHMVKIMGIRHRRNKAPSMKPKQHAISANIASQNDKVLPILNGSGNFSAVSLNMTHLATPWLRNSVPKTIRTARSMMEYAIGTRGSLNSKSFTFMIILFFVKTRKSRKGLFKAVF